MGQFYLFCKFTYVKRFVKSPIKWSAYINAESEWKDLLWVCFAMNTNDIDRWKTCLKSPSPTSATSTEWLFWAAETTAFQAMTKNTIELKTLIEAYHSACPQAQGLMPLALMSVALRHLESSRTNTRKIVKLSNSEAIGLVLQMLPYSSGKVVPEWLAWTHEWVLADFGRNRKTIDLLQSFVTEMKKLVEQGHLSKDATLDRAIEFVQELQKRREALVEST
jgi:hypothetical protein